MKTVHFSPGSPLPTCSVACLFEAMDAHPSLPLVLRREIYGRHSRSGEFQHCDFSALYLVRGGRGVHIIDGQAFAITRGDIYLMRSGATHEYRHFNGLEVDALYFPETLWRSDEREVIGQWRLLSPFADLPLAVQDDSGRWKRCQPRFHLRVNTWREMERQIAEMHEIFESPLPAAPLLLRAGAFRLLWLLAHEQQIPRLKGDTQIRKEPRERGGDTVDAGLDEVIRLCREEYGRPWSVETLAAKAFVSPRHFSTLFARRVGVSPAAYLRQVRLDRAHALLLESRLAVSQIARETGWKSEAQFSRSFKAAFGHSPSEMRRRSR